MNTFKIKKKGLEQSRGKTLKTLMIPTCFLLFFSSFSFLSLCLKMFLSSGKIKGSFEFDFVYPLLNIASALFLIFIMLFAFAPFYIGVHSYFIKKNKKVTDIFKNYSFKKSFKFFHAAFCTLSLKLFVSLFFLSPSLAVIVGSVNSLFKENVPRKALYANLIGGAVLFIIGIIFSMCASSRYAAVPYIIALRNETSLISAMRTSEIIMQGKYLSFTLFRLSFLPWLLLSPLIFPNAFAWSYYRFSCAEWIRQRAVEVKNTGM